LGSYDVPVNARFVCCAFWKMHDAGTFYESQAPYTSFATAAFSNVLRTRLRRS